MAWDPTKPQSTDYQRNFPAQAQANWEAIEDCVDAEHQNFDDPATSGIHKFPVVSSEPTGMEGRVAIVDDVLWHYSNGAWHRSGDVFFPDLTDANLILTDITTNNASALKHGFLPKLSGVSNQYLNGLGQWANADTVDLQVFTNSGTWTKPTGSKLVFVKIIGGGGGGGGGYPMSTGTGGGGGGGGGCREVLMLASELTATVSVTVGSAGSGGSSGNSGSSGNTSYFGALYAGGGGGGGVGLLGTSVVTANTAGGSLGSSIVEYVFSGGAGGRGAGSSYYGSVANGNSTVCGAGGGGAGYSYPWGAGTGGAGSGILPGGSPGNPGATVKSFYCGSGGGGGAADGLNGGAGGYGGGGGGGGARAGGSGASGGAGIVYVWTYR